MSSVPSIDLMRMLVYECPMRPFYKFALVGVVALQALVPFAGCGDDEAASGPPNGNRPPDGTGDGGTPPWGPPPEPSALGKCDPGAESEPQDKTSGYLLMTENRLAQIRADAAAGTKAFTRLKATVERYLSDLNETKSSGENAALLYLLTNDARYAASAYAWAKQAMGKELQRDSYLEYGDIARTVALVLNWAKAGLDAAQQKELADYLEAATNELWFANQGSKWGISDDVFPFAGNNYRMGFIEGTAFAGYALDALGDPRGKRWIDLAIDKIERKGGVLDYIDQLQSGGDWLEGTNYGQRSKQRLYRGLAAIASMGGKNLFRSHPFFANSVQFAVYQVQPGNRFLYPAGDLARSSESEVSPYDREYVQIATYWLCDSPARRLGQHYLTKVAADYDDGDRSFDYGAGHYLDLLFALDLPVHDVTTLPLSYRAAGTNLINARSGWDEHATSVTIAGAPIFSQSHQHQDIGSFLIWKDGWLAANPETFGGDGPFWPAEASQGLHVPNRELRFDGGPVPGLSRFTDKSAAVYAQIDMSGLYLRKTSSGEEKLLNEHTREIVYLRPNTVFVFDRVDAKPAGEGYSLHFHFPTAPTSSGNVYSAVNNGPGIAIAPLLGGAVSVHDDSNLGSSAHRIEQAATGAVSRFLSVVEVGSSGAPALSAQLVGTPGTVRGAIANNHVVIFSDLPRGATPPVPFSYTVPGTGTPTHVLLGMSGSYSITASRSGGSTTVTVAAGNDVKADADGVLVATP